MPSLLLRFLLPFLVLALGQAPPVSAAVPPSEAVVFIEVTYAAAPATPEKVVEGSGFLIDDKGHVLTSASLFRQASGGSAVESIQVHIGNKEGTVRRGQIVDCGSGNIDACLIKISARAVEAEGITVFFQPACRSLALEKVTVMGIPSGPNIRVNSFPGAITSDDLDTSLKYSTDITTPLLPGGPVVDEAGVVVAINSGEPGPFPVAIQPLSYASDIVEKAGIDCEADARSDLIESRLGELAGMVAFFQSACPVGWAHYPALDGRYVVGATEESAAGVTVGTQLESGENRPAGEHVHVYSDGLPQADTPLDRRYTGLATSFDFDGFVGLTYREQDTADAKDPSGASLKNGTNAPYLQLMACLRE